MSEPIRILHILATLNRGGAETMIMNIYRLVDHSKIQFDFIIHTNEKCDYNDEICMLGGKIYNVPRYIGKNHCQYVKAWHKFFNNHSEYKIVHGHIRSTAAIYLKIAKKKGLFTIAHSHSTASRGNTFERCIKKIMQLSIRNTADYLFACSDEAGKWLFGKRAIKKDNYKCVKNAIDVKKYIFDESKRNKMKKVLNIENKFVIGHVGTFTQPKNHKFLIDVFYQYQMKDESSVLLLVGDGELRTQIENQIKELEIKDKVLLPGVVTNVNDYMQAMDIFLFPSLFEGVSLAIIEAQASGLPCIVSEATTTESHVTDLITPLSIRNSSQVWVQKIIEHKDRSRLKNTYEKVKACGYDVSLTAEVLSEFYLSILNTIKI